MAASESPFYSIKRLHRVFAAASLALLAAVVWMVAADYTRDWKRYQRTFRDEVEPWDTEAALRQQEFEQQPGERERLQQLLTQQRPNFGKWLLSLPLIDALGRPLAIDQVWLPELPLRHPFGETPRIDRCPTCHQGIDRAPGGAGNAFDASLPSRAPETIVAVGVRAPAKPPSGGDASRESLLRAAYGMELAEGGRLSTDEVVLGAVAPRTPAAAAGLLPGDVVQSVDGDFVTNRDDLLARLLGDAAWGKSLALAIRRGLPHPYAAHPRLDLFVGAQSPHPLSEFGCTVCHDGQGSATQFKFASHSPDNVDQRARWRREHGWFANDGWDLPMRAKRFAQSNCLKCHPDVAELNSSPRFRDPPAEKLVEGYNLVRQLGCFGCHEINGTSPAGRVVGPDLRLEPNYHEAALGLLADPALSADDKRLAAQVAAHPEDDAARRQLVAALGGAAGKPPGKPGQPGLGQTSKPLIDLLAAELPRPGAMRKVGPSLREVAGRLDAAGLVAWIADPTAVRPSTRMPQLFGIHDHLDAASLQTARRFEPVEIRAMTEYLLSASQSAAADAQPAGVTEPPSAERGKRLFETQGCLACHRHADFPTAQSTVGPDLSHAGALLRGRDAAAWLTGWIRDPARHSPRTRMPSPRLEPTTISDKAASPSPGAGRRADPAADLAAYLMASKGWTPPAMTPLSEVDLDELAVLHLAAAYPQATALEYVRQGIPATMAGAVSGDAAELLAPITREKKLRYVGRRTIRKRGCVGCHDVPGLEDAQGIGPALSNWGNKETTQLAFDGVARLLGAPAARAAIASTDEDRGFYLDAILSKRRDGFLWQKLGAPRSFDFGKTAGKPYAEHLRMGRFNLTDAQREAILTFVLGLSGEAPPAKYAFAPDARGKAIVEGRKVLDRYGCAQCHVMEMERWTIDYDPARFAPPPVAAEFDFLRPAADPQREAASQRVDRRGLCRAELVGMPQVDAEGKLEQTEDEDGGAQYVFSLWETAILAGKTWPVGGASVPVSPGQIAARRPFVGGDFARRLYPQAVALAKAAGSGATSAVNEAWGCGPPSLAYEGRRVEPAWLYSFLLDPTDIRPAAVLRMPRFTLAPAEAQALADYFAALAGAEFPYHADPRAQAVRRQAASPQQAERLSRALRLLTDRTTFCAKCHRAGDADPGGENRAQWAPDLLNVAGRVRPDTLRRWLANPKSMLPYTAMPVNFPPDRRLGQELFPGSSEEQLDAVVDLLLYYREYLARRATKLQGTSGGANEK